MALSFSFSLWSKLKLSPSYPVSAAEAGSHSSMDLNWLLITAAESNRLMSGVFRDSLTGEVEKLGLIMVNPPE